MSGIQAPKILRRGVWRYLSDRDILVAAMVTAILFTASLGLLYAAHFVRVCWLAGRSPSRVTERRTMLVFGRRLVHDRLEGDFIGRLARVRQHALEGTAERVLLLGGFSGGTVSEAEAGQRWLSAEGWPPTVPMLLEQVSIDSLENLRHARVLLRESDDVPLPPVCLVTSRYHLARCLYLARRLGFDAAPLAAEERLPLTRRYVTRLLLEAGYLMWIDTGMRWAALTGNRRMAGRIT